MKLIGYNMRDVCRLRALQLSSRQRSIARSGPGDFTLHFDILEHNQLNLNVL